MSEGDHPVICVYESLNIARLMARCLHEPEAGWLQSGKAALYKIAFAILLKETK